MNTTVNETQRQTLGMGQAIVQELADAKRQLDEKVKRLHELD